MDSLARLLHLYVRSSATRHPHSSIQFEGQSSFTGHWTLHTWHWLYPLIQAERKAANGEKSLTQRNDRSRPTRTWVKWWLKYDVGPMELARHRYGTPTLSFLTWNGGISSLIFSKKGDWPRILYGICVVGFSLWFIYWFFFNRIVRCLKNSS